MHRHADVLRPSVVRVLAQHVGISLALLTLRAHRRIRVQTGPADAAGLIVAEHGSGRGLLVLHSTAANWRHVRSELPGAEILDSDLVHERRVALPPTHRALVQSKPARQF